MTTDPTRPPVLAVLREVARAGMTAVVLHPLRSGVTVTAVLVVLTPLLAGLGLARGLRDEAAAAVALGADLHVACEQFGRPVPVPLAAAEQVRGLPGVASVVPRILGRIELGKDRVEAVVLGVPLEGLPASL